MRMPSAELVLIVLLRTMAPCVPPISPMPARLPTSSLSWIVLPFSVVGVVSWIAAS